MGGLGVNRGYCIISITLLFGDLVYNVNLEGKMSQNFDSS